jgi:hypothetical protein
MCRAVPCRAVPCRAVLCHAVRRAVVCMCCAVLCHHPKLSPQPPRSGGLFAVGSKHPPKVQRSNDLRR